MTDYVYSIYEIYSEDSFSSKSRCLGESTCLEMTAEVIWKIVSQMGPDWQGPDGAPSCWSALGSGVSVRIWKKRLSKDYIGPYCELQLRRRRVQGFKEPGLITEFL